MNFKADTEKRYSLKEFRSYFKNRLSGVFEKEEVLSFFYLLAEEYLNLKKWQIPLQTEKQLSEMEIRQFIAAINRLEKEEPIQYIIGHTEFYGLPFRVNPSVLIPRPETEELVEWVLKPPLTPRHLAGERQNIPPLGGLRGASILDIGTGSGCIAVSLAKNLPDSEISALDISKEALQTAKQNAEINKVKITFLEKDILQAADLGRQYDVIVSNPPYIKDCEKQLMKNNVLKNEPHSALFVPDNDALLFYRKIAKLASTHLKPGGQLFFEINEAHGSDVANLLKQTGFQNVELKKDIFGKDRMVCGSLTEYQGYYEKY